MGAFASVMLLADLGTSLQSFVSVFVSIYILLILVHILLSSWIQLPYSRTGAAVQEFLEEICRPYLSLFRGRVPTLGALDFSPMVAILVLIVAMVVVNRIIGALL
jgi:YggT family protein